MTIIWWILVCYLGALPFILIGIDENLLAFSFYVNAILIAYMARLSLVRNVGGPAFATVSIFITLFFYVAPIYQILEFPGHLINNYSPSLDQMMLANLFVFIFTSLFILLYMRRQKVVHHSVLRVDDDRVGPMLPFLMILSVAMAIWGLQLMLSAGVDLSDDTVAIGTDIGATIRQKFALAIPSVTLGLYLCRYKRTRSLAVVGLLILLVFASKNIVLDRRNALGPVYLSMLFLLFWRDQIGSRSVFLLLGSTLLFAFPVAAIFINNRPETWGEVVTLSNMIEEVRFHFVDLHYDAWANLVASIQFVQTEGLQYGRQVGGALLFFVPRSIWLDKPISSGQLLGDYLVERHGLWFTNISFPFPAEGYIDFGVFGIIGYALLLGWYAQRLDFFINRGGIVNRASALYFAFYLTFVMRGSFLPAFAFGVGTFFALNVLPAILSKISLRSVNSGAPRSRSVGAYPAAGRG